MKKIIITLILILLIILLSIIQNQEEKLNYPSYTCQTNSKSNIISNTKYKLYYDKTTKKIIRFQITKENIAKNKKGEYDLKTLVNIIKTENKEYQNKEGISIKILNNAKNIYKYRITINLKEIKDNNILNNLNSYKTVNEQLKYFKEHEINCKIEKN